VVILVIDLSALVYRYLGLTISRTQTETPGLAGPVPAAAISEFSVTVIGIRIYDV
jgi:hypothetical protein